MNPGITVAFARSTISAPAGAVNPDSPTGSYRPNQNGYLPSRRLGDPLDQDAGMNDDVLGVANRGRRCQEQSQTEKTDTAESHRCPAIAELSKSSVARRGIGRAC
jgi:hypothetical protein